MTPDRPESARLLVEQLGDMANGELARREAAGEVVTEEDFDRIVEEMVALSLACDDVPADALRHFVLDGLTAEVQEHLDAEVLAGRVLLLPDGRYQRAGGAA